jgi:hypothetical protein
VKNLVVRWMRRALTASAMLTLTALFINPAAAHAATGGGCGPTNPIDPCISWSSAAGGQVSADFYVNVTPDYDRCIVLFGVSKNGVFVQPQKTYTLTHTGRYGPITVPTATMPPSRGSAFARVNVYNCDSQFLYSQDSPVVNYP